MASPYTRLSGLWNDYFSEDAEGDADDIEPEVDSRTRLDKTIDRIGMGAYQWTLLSLCGLGWLADNCWLQTVAIILPRVQQRFSVPDNQIGLLSFSLFFGMMIGAFAWGACSDLVGRSVAFNATLFFTALFGVAAGFAPSYVWLCVNLFFLGSAVGGSMPTDGTLLLEHMPSGKKHLLTALSVFFSLGSVLSAVVGIIVLPGNSCTGSSSPCSPEDNKGWKYMLFILGFLTLLMFVARAILFRLHESPRYLVHAGRPQDAVESLRQIAEYNGLTIPINIGDVVDRRRASLALSHAGSFARSEYLTPHSAAERQANYQSVSDMSLFPSWSPVNEPDSSGTRLDAATGSETDRLVTDQEDAKSQPSPIEATRSSHLSGKSNIPKWSLLERFPNALQSPLAALSSRFSLVLSKEWRRTTILIWCIWFSFALAYTVFNVYLPKLLETQSTGNDKPKSLEETMWDIVIFTLGGCPGAILGAYLIQSRLGRSWSLAGSTFLTAAFCVLFVYVSRSWVIRLTTVGISLAATTMWAVLYGMTPEIFATKVRGTACGTASALSRIGGMIAPLAGAILLTIRPSFPVFLSAAVFAVGGICVLLLNVDESQFNTKGRLAVVH